MRLERAIDCLNEFPRSEPIETFRQSIEPHWIEEALLATVVKGDWMLVKLSGWSLAWLFFVIDPLLKL